MLLGVSLNITKRKHRRWSCLLSGDARIEDYSTSEAGDSDRLPCHQTVLYVLFSYAVYSKSFGGSLLVTLMHRIIGY